MIVSPYIILYSLLIIITIMTIDKILAQDNRNNIHVNMETHRKVPNHGTHGSQPNKHTTSQQRRNSVAATTLKRRCNHMCLLGSHQIKVIVLGFNDTLTLVGYFVSSPREREKRDRSDSRRDEREGQGKKKNRNVSEEPEEIKTFPPLSLPSTRIAGLAQL